MLWPSLKECEEEPAWLELEESLRQSRWKQGREAMRRSAQAAQKPLRGLLAFIWNDGETMNKNLNREMALTDFVF